LPAGTCSEDNFCSFACEPSHLNNHLRENFLSHGALPPPRKRTQEFIPITVTAQTLSHWVLQRFEPTTQICFSKDASREFRRQALTLRCRCLRVAKSNYRIYSILRIIYLEPPSVRLPILTDRSFKKYAPHIINNTKVKKPPIIGAPIFEL
jgi:hypothetical protein